VAKIEQEWTKIDKRNINQPYLAIFFQKKIKTLLCISWNLDLQNRLPLKLASSYTGPIGEDEGVFILQSSLMVGLKNYQWKSSISTGGWWKGTASGN
jgi:hypothetical protein